MRKRFFLKLRPGFLLGLLLFGVLTSLGGFLFWYLGVRVPEIDGVKHPITLETQNWLFLIGVYSALVGWIISSMVTIRNSIKQHTINTLLQTRLSVEYMKHASLINEKYLKGPQLARTMTMFEWNKAEHKEGLASLRYVLNYLEFIAVGIRHGDLDESLMKNTIRGIVVSFADLANGYIVHSREGNALCYEHLTALCRRWSIKSGKSISTAEQDRLAFQSAVRANARADAEECVERAKPAILREVSEKQDAALNDLRAELRAEFGGDRPAVESNVSNIAQGTSGHGAVGAPNPLKG